VAPAPTGDLADALAPFPVLLTVEAHSVVGGVGSLVCELVAELGLGSRVIRCGVRRPSRLGGDEAYLNSVHGLSGGALAETARRAVTGVPLPVFPAGNA
jgi:transketolase